MIKTTLAVLFSGFLTVSGATLTHSYVLTNSLSDTLGGPSLAADGGTQSSSGYSFGANQGLNLSSALSNSGDYSVLMDFSLSNLNGFRKFLDFKDRSSDTGLYDLNGALDFFNTASGSPVFSANVLARVVLTRNAGTSAVTGYVNGAQQLSFSDSSALGVFSGTNNIMRFFEDDFATGQTEASGGLATVIQIYNGALSSAEVEALGGPSIPVSGVPEPAALTLVGFGLLALGFVRRIKA